MAIQVDLPDGSVAEFPDGTSPDVMKTAIRKKFPPMNTANEIAAPVAGFNEGLDAAFNLPNTLINAVGSGVNAGAEALGYHKPLPDQLIEPARVATRDWTFGLLPGHDQAQNYQPQTLLGKTGHAIGEVAGSSVLPEMGMLAKAGSLTPAAARTAAPVFENMAARGPMASLKQSIAPTIGAGAGVEAAREADLGPVGEMVGGLLGGAILPNTINIAARSYAGSKAGLDYANRQVERAQNPEGAAYKDIADKSIKAGLDLNKVYQEAAPQPSAALGKRVNPVTGENFTSEDMADIVSRRLQGEHAEDIASEYGLHKDTVQKYVNDYVEANPTPMNLVDIAKQELGSGKAVPLTNEGRNSAALVDDPTSTDRLIRRQREQPGRVADIVEQSSINGRNLSQELDRLATTAKAEERAAYKDVADNAQPIDLTDVIGQARKAALRRGGEIGKGLNDAIDLFFKKVAQPKRISAMDDVRLKEMQERIDQAKNAENPNPDTIKRLQRRFDAMRDDLEYNQNAKPEILKPGTPISDVRSFIDARDELSQMTQQSMKDGKPTMLTAELTKLREALNTAARSTNKALEAADAKYSGNRSIERMIERGGELGKKLTAKTKQALRDFKKLTPTQQEIQRVAFEDKMATEALNVKRGNAAADQFQSDAFDLIVEQMYPKSAGKEIYDRGQNLLKRLRGEAITTETARDILAGSRTAPVQEALSAMKEGAQAGADLITGRFTKVLENLSNRLARQIGQKQAEHRLDILTQADPAKRLMVLKRLASEAKTSSERDSYLMAIKEFAKVQRNPAIEAGVGIMQNKENR